MTSSGGFELHPDAARDITEIWAFIAKNNLAAAARVREELLVAMRGLATFPLAGHRRLDLTTRSVPACSDSRHAAPAALSVTMIRSNADFPL
jgi:plasmid stabilization system protein ParE